MIIYLDTNIVVYVVERVPIWSTKVDRRLQHATSVGDQLAASDAVRFECLIEPLRKGDAKRLSDYTKFFGAPSLLNLTISTSAWDYATSIRATHGYQALDSLHLAAAVEGGCGLFLTAD